MPSKRIYLSPPDVTSQERDALMAAFDSGWIAPVGPHLEAFEEALADYVGVRRAVGLASGTAALHLALKELGVSEGDRVYCSTLTFVASANAIRYCGAQPVFIDSEEASWCLDPGLIADQLAVDARRGTLPKAIEVVDIYGQCADWGALRALADEYEVPLIEDASEALGATHGNRKAGALGTLGTVSFNGNKIATTSGGGAVLTDDEALAERIRRLATQARLPGAGYWHEEVGYNYRLSNLLAAVGVAQLSRLDTMIARRREIFDRYFAELGGYPGITFMPEAPFGRSNRWLTCILIDEGAAHPSSAVIEALEAANIEARPVWRPMHLQPLYSSFPCVNRGVAERFARQGVCLPSGSVMSPEQQGRVIAVIRSLWGSALPLE